MADWNPSDYDPEREAVDEKRREFTLAREHGVDRDTVNAWIRAIWLDFETKLHRHCIKRFEETGTQVSDGDKACYRRDLHEQLRKEFGRSLPDRDWTEKVEQEIARRSGKAA